MGAPTSMRPGSLDRVLDDHVDALYDFALAVAATPDAAMGAVRDAVPRALDAHGAAVGRAALFGAVLDAAVERAEPAATLPAGVVRPDADARERTVPDLEELRLVSRQATLALDPRTRGVVDLALRQGLEGEELAEALGVAPGLARATTQSALEEADRVVGAVVLSRVAHADCAGLATALESHGDEPGAGRLAADVIAHLDACAPCADRRRALVSVTSLLAAVPPLRAPADLRRLRGRFQAPPSAARRPNPPVSRVAAAAVAAAVLVGVAVAVVRRDDNPAEVASPPGGQLLIAAAGAAAGTSTAAELNFGRERDSLSFEVSNAGNAPLEFQARPDARWLQVLDPGASVPPGQRALVRAVLDRARAPEGEITTQVRVSSTGGDAMVPVRAEVDRSPVLSGLNTTPDPVAAVGCPGTTPSQVRVNVVEESGTEEVLLHWRRRRGPVSTVPMAREGQSSYAASLGPFPAAGHVTWWVSVRDIRGNTTASPPAVLHVGGC